MDRIFSSSWVHFIAMVLALTAIMLICRQLAFARMYSYKNDKGSVVFVDSPSEIPKKYRNTQRAIETTRDISQEERSFIEQVFSSAEESKDQGVGAKLKTMTKNFQAMANESKFADAVEYMKKTMRPYIKKNVPDGRSTSSRSEKGNLNRGRLLKDLDSLVIKMNAKNAELERIMKSDDSVVK